jgi:cold-inducible RNA-binding protein
MSCKLFVANFPYSTTNEELDGLFGPHGQVLSVKIATDRETGRSRGFGFVEMASEQEADNAIRELDGYQLGGRSLAVRVAEERSRPGGPGGPGGGPRGPRGPRSDSGGGFGGPRGGGGFGGPRGPRDDGGFGGPGGGGFGRGPRGPRSGPRY